MEKENNNKKKTTKKIVIFLLVLFLGFSLFLLNLGQKDQTPEEEVYQKGPTWKDITPGITSKKDVIKSLGEIKEESSDGNFETAKFSSSSPTRDNKVFFENNTALLIIEIVTEKDNKGIEEIRNKYGVATNVLYGTDSANGFDLYVYPEKGIAFLGNPETDTLLEIWYFTPLDIESFINKFASSYSKTPSYGY